MHVPPVVGCEVEGTTILFSSSLSLSPSLSLSLFFFSFFFFFSFLCLCLSPFYVENSPQRVSSIHQAASISMVLVVSRHRPASSVRKPILQRTAMHFNYHFRPSDIRREIMLNSATIPHTRPSIRRRLSELFSTTLPAMVVNAARYYHHHHH